MNTELLEKLAEILQQSGTAIISEYARWYVVQSFSWICLGIVICFLTVKSKFEIEDQKAWTYIIKTTALFVGMMFIVSNIGDLFAPQGIAIHRLISDLTPA